MEETLIEKSVFEEVPTGKIYTEKAIRIGTFLGGPLVAGYLIAENFKTFNAFDQVKKTWIITILSSILIFGLLFLIPENLNIPNVIFPIIYMGIATHITKKFQEQKINEHLNNGGEKFNGWRTAAVSLIGCAVTLAIIFSVAFGIESTQNTPVESTKHYGVTNNEIVYQDNINENEADKIAAAFEKMNFFDRSTTKYMYLEKTDNNYEISISCNEEAKTNLMIYQYFVQLRKDIQKDFPHNKIIFKLVVDDLTNVVKRIE